MRLQTTPRHAATAWLRCLGSAAIPLPLLLVVSIHLAGCLQARPQLDARLAMTAAVGCDNPNCRHLFCRCNPCLCGREKTRDPAEPRPPSRSEPMVDPPVPPATLPNYDKPEATPPAAKPKRPKPLEPLRRELVESNQPMTRVIDPNSADVEGNQLPNDNAQRATVPKPAHDKPSKPAAPSTRPAVSTKESPAPAAGRSSTGRRLLVVVFGLAAAIGLSIIRARGVIQKTDGEKSDDDQANNTNNSTLGSTPGGNRADAAGGQSSPPAAGDTGDQLGG